MPEWLLLAVKLAYTICVSHWAVLWWCDWRGALPEEMVFDEHEEAEAG